MVQIRRSQQQMRLHLWLILGSSPVSPLAFVSAGKLNPLLKTKELIHHAWHSYIDNAYPHDELLPISCTGRSTSPNQEDIHINDVCGNYSMTFIDALDTLYIIGEKEAFIASVHELIDRGISFDQNVKVQVFESTIRVLGGLLSAHQLASEFISYKGELLELAYELGQRLLPAFETPTSIPYARVNLKFGVPKGETSESCTAGAGSLFLEFALLSRLTNDNRFENVAKNAFFALWNRRSNLNLLGNTIDVLTGKWLSPISSTGAGIDSFFEYALKSYILFDDETFLDVFKTSYNAVLRHVKDERMLYRNVHISSGLLMTHWIDSLAAFFPGLQILAGDLEEAIKLHLLYFSVWSRYHSIPERFNFVLKSLDLMYYPLRPEFAESTYFLYRATKDPFYLQVGEMILNDIEMFGKTRCGFASIRDVNLMTKEDRMESFALSETLKYLFLLFDENNPLNHDDGNFVFTTEGHPLSLPRNLQNSNGRSNDVCSIPPERNFFSSITSRKDFFHTFKIVEVPFWDHNSFGPYNPNSVCSVPEIELEYEVMFGKAFNTAYNHLDLAQNIFGKHDGFHVKHLDGLGMRVAQKRDVGLEVTRFGQFNTTGKTITISDPLYQAYATKDLLSFSEKDSHVLLQIEGYKHEHILCSSAVHDTSDSYRLELMSHNSDAYGCIEIETNKSTNSSVARVVQRGGCPLLQKIQTFQDGITDLVVVVDTKVDLTSLIRPSLGSLDDQSSCETNEYQMPTAIMCTGQYVWKLLSKASMKENTKITIKPTKQRMLMRGKSLSNVIIDPS